MLQRELGSKTQLDRTGTGQLCPHGILDGEKQHTPSIRKKRRSQGYFNKCFLKSETDSELVPLSEAHREQWLCQDGW